MSWFSNNSNKVDSTPSWEQKDLTTANGPIDDVSNGRWFTRTSTGKRRPTCCTNIVVSFVLTIIVVGSISGGVLGSRHAHRTSGSISSGGESASAPILSITAAKTTSTPGTKSVTAAAGSTAKATGKSTGKGSPKKGSSKGSSSKSSSSKGSSGKGGKGRDVEPSVDDVSVDPFVDGEQPSLWISSEDDDRWNLD